MTNESPETNISLRDYFAAQAMNASISHHGLNYNRGTGRNGAFHAYLIADEMLRARDLSLSGDSKDLSLSGDYYEKI